MDICGTPPRDRTCLGIDESYLFLIDIVFHFGFDKWVLVVNGIKETGWFKNTRFLLPVQNQPIATVI